MPIFCLDLFCTIFDIFSCKKGPPLYVILVYLNYFLYILGVIIGGMTALVATPNEALVGSSGGIYALIFAFVVNVGLNYDIMTRLGLILRLAVIFSLTAADLGTAIYRAVGIDPQSRVSYAAHLGGTVINYKGL